VVEVGADVGRWRVGDRAIVPFQVSCGACPACSADLTSQCTTYGSFDMYGGIGVRSDGAGRDARGESVRQLGGSIDVESEVGVGTTFRFAFPKQRIAHGRSVTEQPVGAPAADPLVGA